MMILPGFGRAQLVTLEEARAVAENYIALITGGTGSW